MPRPLTPNPTDWSGVIGRGWPTRELTRRFAVDSVVVFVCRGVPSAFWDLFFFFVFFFLCPHFSFIAFSHPTARPGTQKRERERASAFFCEVTLGTNAFLENGHARRIERGTVDSRTFSANRNLLCLRGDPFKGAVRPRR